MIEFKTLQLKAQSKNFDIDFFKESGIDPSLNIDIILNAKYEECKELLTNKLEDYLVVFDDGINLVGRIHEVCKQNHLNTKVGLTYVVLTSKMVTLLIGIRKMIYSGLVDCIKNLNRPFIETIDVFYACLINKKLSDSFSNTNEIYDNNKFYWNNFSKEKLIKEYNKLFHKISMTEDYIKFLNNRRKALRSFFSESIHSSFNSAFVNYLMYTLDFELSDNCYGKVTTAYPMMLMKLIEEIFILSRIFHISLEQKISDDLKNIEIRNIDPLYLHFYNKFDYLYSNNWEQLTVQSEQYTKFFEEAINQLKEK